jgi:hypothetical protein
MITIHGLLGKQEIEAFPANISIETAPDHDSSSRVFRGLDCLEGAVLIAANRPPDVRGHHPEGHER